LSAAQWAWHRYASDNSSHLAASEYQQVKRLRAQLARRKHALQIVRNYTIKPCASGELPNASALIVKQAAHAEHADQEPPEDANEDRNEGDTEYVKPYLLHSIDAEIAYDRGVLHLPLSWHKRWQPTPAAAATNSCSTTYRALLWASEISSTMSVGASMLHQLHSAEFEAPTSAKHAIELHIVDRNAQQLAKNILLFVLQTVPESISNEWLIGVEAIWCNWALFPWQQQLLSQVLHDLIAASASLESFAARYATISMRGVDEYDQLLVSVAKRLGYFDELVSAGNTTHSNNVALEQQDVDYLQCMSSDSKAAVLLAAVRDQWMQWQRVCLPPDYQQVAECKKLPVTEVAGGRLVARCIDDTPARIVYERFGFLPISQQTLATCSDMVREQYDKQLAANTAALDETSIMLRNPILVYANNQTERE
jgi:hypothetical protein